MRDLVRHIQNLRKECGFNVDDRITIEYHTDSKLAEAILKHADYIRQETLANSLSETYDGESFAKAKIAGNEVYLRLSKV